MTFSFSALLTIFTFSLVVKCSGNKATINLNYADSEENSTLNHYEQSEISESDNRNSKSAFETTLQELNSQLSLCYGPDGLDVSCYLPAKISVLELAKTIDASDLSEREKTIFGFNLSGFKNYQFPKMDKDAEEKCTSIQHPTTACVHFNFQSYESAIFLFKHQSERTLKEVLDYDTLVPSAQDNFLNSFKASNSKFQRLLSVPTEKWEDEPAFGTVEQNFIIAKDIHNQVLSILKSKGIQI